MLLCYCGTAFGWGKSGHDAIAYIAECNLTPKARKNIEKYLDGRSIVYYASWMDVYRHTPAYKVTSCLLYTSGSGRAPRCPKNYGIRWASRSGRT